EVVGRGGRQPPGGGAGPPAPLRLARARRGGRTAGGGRALGLDLCVDRAPGIEQEAAQQRGDHVPTSSATLRRPCRQSSLPSTSMVSNRGGDALRPVTASRSTKNRCLVFQPRSADNARLASSSAAAEKAGSWSSRSISSSSALRRSRPLTSGISREPATGA